MPARLNDENLYLHPKERSNKATPNGKGFRKLPIERYDHRRGLTSSQIHQTIIAPEGRIWMATPAGLACFDGVNIRIFGRKQGLASHGLRTLAYHHNDHTLWIGTDIGIEVLDISTGFPKSLWTNNIGTINALAIGPDAVFVGSSQGLYMWNEKQSLKPVPNEALKNETIEVICASSDSSFWIVSSGSGLSRISSSGQTLSLDETHKLFGKPNVLAELDNSSVLVGGSYGIGLLSGSGAFLSFCALPAAVNALYADGSEIWAAYGKNLASLSLTETKFSEPLTVLDDTNVKHITKDRFNNVWLSTSGQSLLRLSNLRNTFVDGFPTQAGHILSLYADHNGQLIGGSQGLILESGDVILDDLEIWDVLRDQDNKIWSATHKGLYCTPNPHLSFRYRHEDCRVVQAPCRALIRFQNQLYVASIRGLARITFNGVEEVLDPDGNSFGYVYSLHLGPGGNLWIATLGRGLFRYDGNTLQHFPVEGMADNSNVYALSHDDDGSLFIAHDNRITRRDKEGVFHLLVESEGSIAAWSIGWMSAGNLVAGSSSGLTIYDDKTGEIHHKISGNFEDIPWEFTTSRSLSIVNNSTLICGLGSGLRTVKLNELLPENQSPSAQLSDISWRGTQPTKERHKYIVQAGKWHVKIDIATNWFLDRCQMRYHLDGFDENWSDYQNLGPIRFTSLPKGKYVLFVEIYSPLAGPGAIQRIVEFEIISPPKDE